jgi:hypothetical protein
VRPFLETANAYKGLDQDGTLIPDTKDEPSPGGSLVSPDSDGAVNYPAPSFYPQTGLFYVNATGAFSIFYLPVDEKDASGYGRGSEYHTGMFPSSLKALDYKTGALKWSINTQARASGRAHIQECSRRQGEFYSLVIWRGPSSPTMRRTERSCGTALSERRNPTRRKHTCWTGINISLSRAVILSTCFTYSDEAMKGGGI